MRPLPVQTIQGAPDVVRGVAIVRGAPLPVIDAARLLGANGGAAHERATIGRFVTIRVGERFAVLAVEAVLGVRHLPPDSLVELAPLLREAAAETIAKIGALDAQLLVVLQTVRLVPDSVWRSLDARATQAPRAPA